MYSKVISLLQIAFFIIAFSIIYGLYKLIDKTSPFWAFVIAAVLVLTLFYMYFIEPNMLTLTHIDLKFQDYPLDKPTKILQLSDLHYDDNGIIYKKTTSTIEKENPDIIVITGDFIGERRNEKVVNFCKQLVGLERPIYAIMGNWDHKYPGGIKELKKVLSELGITVLINSNVEISPRFHIAGTDDPYFGYANLKKTFKEIPQDAFTILLTHAPDIVYDAVKYNPRLILCGHTHGGQVKLPVIKAIYVPSKYGARFLEGMFQINGVYFYVNRGIGESHLRIRFFSTPEITTFTLHR